MTASETTQLAVVKTQQDGLINTVNEIKSILQRRDAMCILHGETIVKLDSQVSENTRQIVLLWAADDSATVKEQVKNLEDDVKSQHNAGVWLAMTAIGALIVGAIGLLFK